MNKKDSKIFRKIALSHNTYVRHLIETNSEVQHEFQIFITALRAAVNNGYCEVTETEAIDMLSLHMVTKPAFDAIFANSSTIDKNPISQALDPMMEVINRQKQYETQSENQYSNVG